MLKNGDENVPELLLLPLLETYRLVAYEDMQQKIPINAINTLISYLLVNNFAGIQRIKKK